MRIMDIEAMKREASETQISKLNQGNISPVSAPTAGTGKTTQEVAKKIAKAAGVKSKSMRLPHHSALATSRFWQDLRPGWGFVG